MSTGPTDTTYTAYNMANILCHFTYDEDFYILIQVQRSRCDFRVNGYFPAVYNFCMENGKTAFLGTKYHYFLFFFIFQIQQKF